MAATLNEFHTSYYLSLRRDYQCSARQALEKVKRADTMIIGHHRAGVEAAALVSAVSLKGCVRVVRQYLERLIKHPEEQRAPVSLRRMIRLWDEPTAMRHNIPT